MIEMGGMPFTFDINASEKIGDFFARTLLDKQLLEPNQITPQQALLPIVDADFTAENIENVPRLVVRAETNLKIQASASDTDKLESFLEGHIQTSSEQKKTVAEESPGGEAFDMYVDFLAKLVRVLSNKPLNENELATLLCIEKSQSKAWLKRAAEDGVLKKLKNPVRYALHPQSSLC